MVDQYKYTLLKNEDNTLIIKKKTLNWSTYEDQRNKRKKIKIKDDITDIADELSKIVL